MVFVILSMLFFFVQNVSNKEFGARFATSTKNLFCFQFIAHIGMAVALVLAKMSSWQEELSGLTGAAITCAVLYGFTYLTAIMCLSKAMTLGPVGPTVLIVNMSLVLSVACSVIFFGEQITWNRALGFPCVLAALILSAVGGKEGQKANLRWFVITLITFFADGALSIISKVYTYSFPDASTDMFLLISVLAGLLASGEMYFTYRRAAKTGEKIARPGLFAALALSVGLSTLIATAFNLRALGVVDAALVFPVRQGGLILMIALYGIVRYKDKFDLKTALMFASGLAGIVLFNI